MGGTVWAIAKVEKGFQRKAAKIAKGRKALVDGKYRA
jgi:hypothetical protein